ncbi:MAG: TFIIB-type zinc ribbon-containing protein [Acidobacteria bacterium]|nr:MAG: TFIIB-type zinc ribbon-containing protein [Acidobacteriota bacterium]REK01626.1 MAG: TFIIB-type zinc ribbon-containing protein [Acidobacteriota bacterium]REK14582.1 MAG: TFIIB-type zinc ribbon-containing protein [Acidobacteriota bacterium]REK45297.1 MAG: TFIIB-type zinc ribbon-containing protein [Acidobacteriota bacterium]
MAEERDTGEGFVKRHSCNACGADMVFDPKIGELSCPYCGTIKEIEDDPSAVKERDLATFLRPEAERLQPLAKEALQVSCNSCGATVTFVPPETATSCDFCAAKIVAQPKAADPLVAPEGVLPFSVENKTAARAVSKWTKTRWFAPNKLKTMARHDRATSIYIPYWTFDADTSTDYTGQRGDNYHETEHFRDAQGKQRSRTVTKTRWSYASGHVSRHFDDVTVPATTSVLPKYLSRLEWDFTGLTSYDPAFLSGHKAQTYQVTLESGLRAFQSIAESVIRRDVASDIGGDHQRIDSMDTRYANVTFKHLLVPVYAGAYRYNNKVYQVIVNGRSGEVFGERPYSALKIGCLVLAIIFVIVLLILILSLFR